MIEHALYASTQSRQRDGYQVVASSPGARTDDLRELAVWCPSHDGLLDAVARAPSLNGFPLPSGAYCVARSFAVEAEYSGRGGVHVVTHALLVPPDDYLRFANNPFALMQAALAAGHVLSTLPKLHQDRSLAPFELVGRARPFDRSIVRQVVMRHSIEALVRALDACLQAETAILVVEGTAQSWMAAVLNCLPTGVRPKISLATGLAYSSRRPYEWMAHPPGTPELRRLKQSFGVRVVNLSSQRESDSSSSEVHHAWTAVVRDHLVQEDYLVFERLLRELESIHSAAELDRLAAMLLERSPHPAGTFGPVPLGQSGENFADAIGEPPPLTTTW